MTQKKYVIGVSMGRWSPFHRGNWLIFRRVAPLCDNLMIFVAGQKESMENPFSYDLRKYIIRKSLGPLTYKTHILPAVTKKGSKTVQSGYIYTFLDKISDAVEKADGVFILTGADRFETYREQLRNIKKETNEQYKNVRVVNGGLGLNEFMGKIDASSIRGALLAGDVEFVKKYMAPPITKNPHLFQKIYEMMRREIQVTSKAQEFEQQNKNA